jgi:cysteine desulfurase
VGAVYLDNSASTKIAPEVIHAMHPWLAEEYGNASSLHSYGQRASEGVETARKRASELINATPSEVVFTCGGTESDNSALFGVVNARQRNTSHIIVSSIEHHAILHAAEEIQKSGVLVTFVPVGSSGVVDPDDVRRAITSRTVLISVMHANNELGTIQPLPEISRIAREHGVCFHTDAVQSVGKIPVDVETLGVDLLSLSAHKFHGPKGAGALYVRRGTKLKPLLYGGSHERGRRAGTENVPGIVGLGKAAELACQSLSTETRQIGPLRDRLEEGILSLIPAVTVNGARDRRLPNITNICFESVDGDALVVAMDRQGVACSTGAACSSGSLEPSHVLTAIGKTREDARSSIRFSFGRFNTVKEVDYVLDALPGIVSNLRSMTVQGHETVA